MEVDFTQYYITVTQHCEVTGLFLRDQCAEHAQRVITKVLGYFVITTRARTSSKIQEQCFRTCSTGYKKGFRIFCHNKKSEICPSQFEAHAIMIAGLDYELVICARVDYTSWRKMRFAYSSSDTLEALKGHRGIEEESKLIMFIFASFHCCNLSGLENVYIGPEMLSELAGLLHNSQEDNSWYYSISCIRYATFPLLRYIKWINAFQREHKRSRVDGPLVDVAPFSARVMFGSAIGGV